MDPDVTGSTVAGYSIREALNALPTLSISMAPADFLGPTGIYQNPRSTGNTWERTCALEFIDPNSTRPDLAEDCQIEIHGNSSRRPFRVQKHSFRLTFRGDLGNSKLRYPLLPGSPVEEFNQLVLRACFTDAWCLVSWDPGRYRPDDATYLRDLWMRESHAAMGYLATGSRYCHLYINGLYWGMYLISERVDDEFVSAHLGGTAADWEVVHDFTDPDPSPASAWKSMFAAANAGLATPAAYAAIQEWLDPVRFIDYYLLHQYGEAEDWPHHNGYAFRRKTGPDTRYQWGVWDQEIALNNHGIDRVSANAPNTTTDRTPGRLLNRLRANAEFRLLFADRAHRHLHGGALDIGPSQARWEAGAALIDQAIVAESARWGDTAEETPYGNTGFSRPGVPLKPFYTREADWLPVTALVRDNWIPSLHNTTNAWATIRRLRAAGLYPLTDPPITDPPPGISLPGLEVNLSSPAGGIYYTLDGTDPREPITGAPLGMPFLSGTPVKLTESAVLKARTLNGGEWSALTEAAYFIGAPASAGNLKISEIFFHPAESPLSPEFIELFNPSALFLDLSGVRFSEGINYTFPAGTQLAPGARLVLTGEQFEGRLDNAGEFLTLLAASGAEIFRFRYGVASPWPGGINGEGASLVLSDPFADPADPSNWRPSLIPGGSPGGSDATSFAGEPEADSDGDGSSDFLEYAMGTAADDPSKQPAVEISEEAGFLVVSFSRAAAADDVRVMPEVSSGLDVWNPQFSLRSRHPGAAGMLEEVWKSAAPVPPPAYVRLRATGRP